MKLQRLYILFFFVVLTFKTQAQCAMCRAVLENEQGQTTAEGINNGIVYLMAIPYLLVGSLAVYIYYRFFKLKK